METQEPKTSLESVMKDGEKGATLGEKERGRETRIE